MHVHTCMHTCVSRQEAMQNSIGENGDGRGCSAAGVYLYFIVIENTMVCDIGQPEGLQVMWRWLRGFFLCKNSYFARVPQLILDSMVPLHLVSLALLYFHQ